METFKKGSIVPRRLGILMAKNKYAQHCLVFGVDVVFDGVTLKSARPQKWGEPLVRIAAGMYCKRKNGTRQRSGFYMGKNWSLTSFQDPDNDVYGGYFSKE